MSHHSWEIFMTIKNASPFDSGCVSALVIHVRTLYQLSLQTKFRMYISVCRNLFSCITPLRTQQLIDL